MNHRAEYLLQILEKIGSPLMVSVIDAGARAGESPVSEAQRIAELLAKTVQTGIDMGYALDLGPTGEVTDSIRLALAGVAAPLIGGSFRNTGKAPSDIEVKKIVTAMQAVLTFAENFSADSDHTERLKNISAAAPTDPAQMNAQYINAFVPVVNALGEFTFGQQEQKLVMEIASRLTAAAAQFREALAGNLGPDNKRAELGALTALAALYAASHRAETARITHMTEQQRAQALGVSGMDAVWKGFETRAAMLETLARGLMSIPAASTGAGGGPPPQPVAAAAPPPVQPVQQAPATPPAGGNPLSMFAKKPAETQAAPPPPPPSAPPAAPPPQDQPPPQQQQGGGPMSFFKQPPKEGGG